MFTDRNTDSVGKDLMDDGIFAFGYFWDVSNNSSLTGLGPYNFRNGWYNIAGSLTACTESNLAA